MFKKILVALGIATAALTFQTPANADVKVGFKFGHGVHLVKKKKVHQPKHHKAFGHKKRSFHKPVHKKKVGFHKPVVKKHFHKPVHKKKYALTNKQLRYHLKQHGLYKIRFVDRYHGVAKIVAHSHKGFIAKYKVSTYSGRILDSAIIRPIGGFHRVNSRVHY